MQGGGTEEQYQQLRAQLGLDQPWWLQYGHWLQHALLGDLGVSFFTGERVVTLLNGRVGVTLTLMIGVLIVCVVAGLTLGIASALRGGLIGRAIDVLSMLGLIFPSFWVALVFIAIFAVGLGWFPATGYTPLPRQPAIVADGHGVAGHVGRAAFDHQRRQTDPRFHDRRAGARLHPRAARLGRF